MANSARTKRVCKPGDRARILGGGSGANTGRIVVVVRKYITGQELSGYNDWLAIDKPWVVVSLGEPLRCFKVRNGKRVAEVPPVMSLAIEDALLHPLSDDEGGIEECTLRAKPERRKAVQ